MKTTRKPRKVAVNKYQTVPTIRESEYTHAARSLVEHYPMTRFIRNSYVLSRFWAWLSQIQLKPHLRIPVPRFLTNRDP
jgi:hypothetical protein